MLNYSNNKLTIKSAITNADTIIKLYSDKEYNFTGVLTLANQITKAVNFIKENKIYKARLLITEEDLPYLNDCKFHLVMLNGETSMKSNQVTILFDALKIKQTVKLASSHELTDIKLDLAKLTKKLEDVISKAPSFTVTPATPINTKYVKPGMIPVAIDETGRCIFQYPFIDHVTEINGQKTVNNAILITAKDIPIEQTDVATAIKAHTDAIKELNNLMQTISSELKSTKNKVADIEKALLQHTDSSII